MKRFLAVLLTISMLPVAFVSANTTIWGDADGDNRLSVNDVSFTLQNILTEGEYIKMADVDENGVINSKDAALILQKVLDNSFVLPVEKNNTTETTTEITTEATTEFTTEKATETTTELTTEITTEEPTEITTEELTETTTIAPIPGVITSDYELTPTNFSGNEYFTTSGDFSSSSSERIRLYQNSLKFKVGGNANIYITAKHASNTTEGTRTVFLSTSNGTYIASNGYEKGVDPTEVLYATVGRGSYVITSSDHINLFSVRVVLSEVDQSLELSTETESSTEATTIETTTKSDTPATLPEVPTEITTTGNRIDVSNFSDLKTAVTKTNVDIYITDDIECTQRLNLSNKNANVNIIGVTKADGTSPKLDFTKFRDTNTSTGSSACGIYMNGSKYNLENLIVEKAGDCGMRITGSGSGYALVKNCVFRYNNNSGISVTSGGSNNTFIGVDSYRNGDIVQKCGDDADGFSVKLQAGENNYFYSCRAFENSDDGWDSYDRGTPYIGSVYYIECLAWNNGNPYVFTGEYDYEKGYALDKNLLYVEAILKEYPDFETEYNNRTVVGWPEVTITLYGNMTRNYSELHSTLWGGNPNGFKFGSAETPNTSYRYVENCIAFDHLGNEHQTTAKGYDQNNGSANYDIINGLSFDNVQNYWMGKMTALSQQGTALSFGGENNDDRGNLDITTPSEDEQIALREKVHSYKKSLYEKLYNDIIPGVELCDVFN
ncbi:MAG: right-handed parallel beta-helix repeat-containing protein [Lachnospirales bacterium]